MTLHRLKLIRDVLEECNRQQVHYCVLRNYGFLLEGRSTLFHAEKSVDIAVAQADFPRWETIMRQFQFKPRDPHYTLSHRPYFRIEPGAAGIEAVSFDLQVGGVHWNDLRYIDEDDLFAHRVKEDFFYVPGVEEAFIMLLVHSILGKRKFKPEYQQRLRELGQHLNSSSVEQRLTAIFNRRQARWLLQNVFQGDFTSIIDRKYWLMLVFVSKSFRRFRTFWRGYARFMWWQDHLDPYLLISVIGPDGAGKSTVAQALYSTLRKYRQRVALVYFGRGRENILPITALGRRYKNQEKRRDGKPPEPAAPQNKLRPANTITLPEQATVPSTWKRRILYTLAAPIFTLDQLFRYWFLVLPKRRSKTIVITDRYCSDLLLMKHVPLCLKRVLLSLFPRPTITFYLHQRPEILHQRRPQESVKELQRQLALFEKLKTRLHPIEIKTIDQRNDTDHIVTMVLTYLYQKWY